MVDGSSHRLVQRALHGYSQGVYTFLEAYHQLLDYIDPANVAHVVEQLPEEFVAHIRSEIDAAPHTEGEWDELRLYHIGSALFAPAYDPPSAEEQRTLMEANKKEYRNRIETIRDYFAVHDNPTVP